MDWFTFVLVICLLVSLFVVAQAVVIAYLVKWNRELVEEVEELKPPF